VAKSPSRAELKDTVLAVAAPFAVDNPIAATVASASACATPEFVSNCTLCASDKDVLERTNCI